MEINSKILDLKKQGFTPSQIATTLNTEGLTTARGRPWADHSVNYVLLASRNGTLKGKKAGLKSVKAPATPGAAVISKVTGATAAAKRAPARKLAARKTEAFGAGMTEGQMLSMEQVSQKILGFSAIPFNQRIALLNNLVGQ